MNRGRDKMARKTSRRGAIGLGLGLVAVATGWQLWIGRPRAFAFEPIEDLPGWRRLGGTAVSVGSDTAVFAGIGGGEAVRPLTPARLCEVLFSEAGRGVPVAVFTDVNCPFCRQTMPGLVAREARGEIALSWLEWPVFGEPSEAAARLLLAAEGLGGADPLRRVLYAAPGANLSRVVREAGLSPERLRRGIEADAVDIRLEEVAAAASLLGAIGTPTMVVGRTVVTGALDGAELDRLIAIESELGPPPCSA